MQPIWPQRAKVKINRYISTTAYQDFLTTCSGRQTMAVAPAEEVREKQR